jgi:hypothetical protein
MINVSVFHEKTLNKRVPENKRRIQAGSGHIHEQLQILVNMAILRTKVNPIMENKTRNFEQKLAKIAKAGAANTPLPHDNY